MPAEDERRTRQAGGSFTLALVAVAAAAVAVIMAVAALWAGHPSGASPARPAAGTVVPNGETKTFSIELGDMFVRPPSIPVPYGTRVVLHVANNGTMDHDLQLEGGSTGTGMLAPGERQTVDYGVFGSTQQAWSTVPGHKAAGMILTIKVTAGPPAATSMSAGAAMSSAGTGHPAPWCSTATTTSTSPLRVRAGQRIRLWVLDAGPSDDSAFHAVGAQFTTVFNNGAYLLQPGNPAGGAAQTLNLMPGEGGFAEFTVAAPGQYEMLDHHLDHAAAGAVGYLIAGS